MNILNIRKNMDNILMIDKIKSILFKKDDFDEEEIKEIMKIISKHIKNMEKELEDFLK